MNKETTLISSVSKSSDYRLLPNKKGRTTAASLARKLRVGTNDQVDEKRLMSLAEKDPRSKEMQIKCKKYDGYVTAIDQGSFWSSLTDEEDNSQIDVEFTFSQLSPQDRVLVSRGTPIVWVLTSEHYHGTRRNNSVVYVRRLAQPDEAAVREAGAELQHRFGGLFE